jgi:tetrahydromethanopterin S-methyltransferase subunit A
MADALVERKPERPWAVHLMHRLDALGSLLTAQSVRRALRRRTGQEDWPVVDGAYQVGNPREAVAICTLTDNDLIKVAARLPGVAIAGRVYTANLGLEKIVLNVTANPYIRFVLLCGRDSPLFHPGQTLSALCANGVTPDRRVVGAEGYLPVLGNVPLARIEQFRRQIELVDCTAQTDPEALATRTRDLAARTPGPFRELDSLPTGVSAKTTDNFAPLRPGGKRQPLAYDPKGYFVITLDRAAGEIVLRHYLHDNTPAHEMRGRSGESMLLGLLRKDLVSQLSHAGYLGAELARAEAALHLGLHYEQDQPLRPEAA